MATAPTSPMQMAAEARGKANLTRTQQLLEIIGARHHMIEASAAMTEYEDRRLYEIREGIAIIDISGALASEPGWWYQDYGQIVCEVEMAAEDPDVSGIMLRINSPGGETTRAFESAAMIEEAGKKKPLWCVADANCYSAGYLLACTASRIYAAPISGGVGSIGVYGMHVDYSEALKKNGVKVTLVSAGKGKTDGNPWQPLSDAALKTMEAEINRLYGEFVGFVSRRRKMSADDIRKMGAALKHGAAQAIESGLADRAGTLDVALAEMAAYVAKRRDPMSSMAASAAMQTAQERENAMSQPNPADTAAAASATPPLTEAQINERITAARNEGRAQGLADAQEILSLCAIANMPSKKALAFLKDGKKLSAVRDEILASQEEHAGEPTDNRTTAATGAAADAEAAKEKPTAKADASLLAAVERMYPTKEGK